MKKSLFLGYKEYRNGGEIWRKDTKDFIERPDIDFKSQAQETTPLRPKNKLAVNFKGQRLTAEIPKNED